MAAEPRGLLATRARAKVNLTLAVLGRRADGYHELDSLVAFAGVGDGLSLEPDAPFGLAVSGPFAAGLAADDDNLVLRAALLLNEAVSGLRLGRFHLVKRLPVASGIGGGSADAAAALRLLARLNGLPLDAPGLLQVARAVGADVPVCLASRARVMGGIGERLGPPLRLPPLFAVLVNPGVAVATAAVFRELGLAAGETRPGMVADLHGREPAALPRHHVIPDKPRSGADPGSIVERDALRWIPGQARDDDGLDGGTHAADRLIPRLIASTNDLEAPARRLAPVIGEVLAALAAQPGCRLARMSGSGATCFGLFDDCRVSAAAARVLRRVQPGWWVKATVLR